MAEGPGYRGISKDVKVYYARNSDSSAATAMPDALADAVAFLTAGNLFAHTKSDVIFPAVRAAAADQPLITDREHGAEQVIFANDIQQEPTAAENQITIPWNADLSKANASDNDSVQRTLLDAPANTHGLLLLDLQTKAGDGNRATASGSAEGMIMVYQVSHGDAAVTAPASAAFFQGETVFSIVASTDNPPERRKTFFYGHAA